MSESILLVMADALEASAVRSSLIDSRDVAADVECVFRCSEGLQRLRDSHLGVVTAAVIDLFLPDSQGIATFEAFFQAYPQVPILIVNRTRDESIAREAVRRGAQDYLLLENVDSHTLPKALRGMSAARRRSTCAGVTK